jgi:hypothetical protein
MIVIPYKRLKCLTMIFMSPKCEILTSVNMATVVVWVLML